MGDSIHFVNATRKEILIFPASLKIETVVIENFHLQKKLESILNNESSEVVCRKAGEILLKKIKEMPAVLPWPPSKKDLRVEEVAQYIPKELSIFMEGLIKKHSPRANCHQLSLAQDLNCAAGIRTPKSVLFHAVVKGLTNNTIVLQIINRLGHGVIYDILEELDTLEAMKNIDFI